MGRVAAIVAFCSSAPGMLAQQQVWRAAVAADGGACRACIRTSAATRQIGENLITPPLEISSGLVAEPRREHCCIIGGNLDLLSEPSCAPRIQREYISAPRAQLDHLAQNAVFHSVDVSPRVVELAPVREQ